MSDDSGGRPKRFTVAQYHRLTESGILTPDDRIELLEGYLVLKRRIGPREGVSITKCNVAIAQTLSTDWHVRVQMAVTTADSEPEPDLAVVAGQPDDYGSAHPTPAHLALAAEVSESTLADDRSIKLRIYAAALITQYWIINLVDRQVEVYTDPSGPQPRPEYRDRTNYAVGSEVPLVIAGQVIARIPVTAMLPA